MNLKSLSKPVLVAGTLAALVQQPLYSQTIAPKPKAEVAKKVDVKRQISDLYDRIKNLEFDFEQSRKEGDFPKVK